jgi:hypothetical protein
MTVAQGLLQILARLLVLVELVEAMTLIGRISRRSEFIDFFLLFWCLLPKGEKIRGVNQLFDAL